MIVVDITIGCTIISRCLRCWVFVLQCPHRPWPDRQWGLCIFDDVVEHCSPASFKYAEYFLRPMLESVCDSSPEVRQAAAYGVGVMAQFGGDSYRPVCPGTDRPMADETLRVWGLKWLTFWFGRSLPLGSEIDSQYYLCCRLVMDW